MDDKSNAQQKIEKVYGIPNIKNVVPKIADGIGKQVDTSKRLMEDIQLCRRAQKAGL